jgi:hypothetical protein
LEKIIGAQPIDIWYGHITDLAVSGFAKQSKLPFRLRHKQSKEVAVVKIRIDKTSLMIVRYLELHKLVSVSEIGV